MVVVGEVGLSGELRSVTQLERRVNEAARLGFKRCLVPRNGAHSIPTPQGIELLTAATLREAVRVGILPKEQKGEELDL
jgi:DNA repair protein RadA/Sms